MKKIYKKTLGLLLCALFVGTLTKGTAGYMSLLMRDLVDESFLLGMERFGDIALRMVLVALMLFLLETLLSVAKGWYRKKTNVALKMHYLGRVFQKNINEFNKDSNAKYVSHMTNDLNTVDQDYIDGIFEMALALILFFVTIIIIAGVSIEILGIVLVVGVSMGVLSNLLSKPIQKLYEERSGLYDKYTHYLSEVLHAFRIIRVNNLYPRVEKNFKGRSQELQDKSFDIEKKSTYIYAVQNFTINMVVLFVISISVFYAVRGDITFGGVILIINNFSSLIGPFQQASERFPKILSARKLFAILDASLENQEEGKEHLTLSSFQKGIELSQVSYAYGENVVLKDVDLTLKKKGKYLIVGPSGGGKSTFLKLLRKYFRPTEGKLLIDGLSLEEVTKESYFNHLSSVEQNVFMFDDTLRNNLTLYKEVSEEKLHKAMDQAGLLSFVGKLDQGLDTVMEDNGRNISGGERARIAIARALLGETDILVLDEAFQSLDYETARSVEGTILSLEELTVLNVSHIIMPENKHRYDALLYVDRGTITMKPVGVQGL